MYKKLIKYTDIDGNPKEKEFYFNLTEAEIVEMQLAVEGGLDEHIKTVVAEGDNREIMKFFKNIVLTAVGERVDDCFMKSPEYRNRFVGCGAYSALIMEFIDQDKNPTAAADFIKAIFPASLASKMKETPGMTVEN